MTRPCAHPVDRQQFVHTTEHPHVGFAWIHVYRCNVCDRELQRLMVNESTVADVDAREGLELFRERARAMCFLAVQMGWLVRPDSCGICGDADGLIDAHHYDYGRPLEVEWLCRTCHHAADAFRRLTEAKGFPATLDDWRVHIRGRFAAAGVDTEAA